MGKLDSQNFDMQIASVTTAYFIAVAKEDWELAHHLLSIKHNTLRPTSRINDLPECKQEDRGLKSELKMQTKYKDWCLKYAPLIEAAVTLERDKLARGYGR